MAKQVLDLPHIYAGTDDLIFTPGYIPALSEWGAVILTLALLTAAETPRWVPLL